MTVLGCIADDFTGATDLAGVLARSGLPVTLRIGVPGAGAADPASFEVIALKIRTAPTEVAVSEALAALDWLRGAGAVRFFWKYCSTFDSRPTGTIGPVAEALMEALGADQTLYCPTFPENGRTVYMGNLFVGQQPLAESPMKDHPLTPMRDSNLMRLLSPQVRGEVGLVDYPTVAQGAGAIRAALARLAERGVAHVITDAIADADLAAIAAASQDLPLLTGGSALAMSLPALFRQAGQLPAQVNPLPLPKVDSCAIVLSGSCSAMTNRQVQDYISRGHPGFRLDPLHLAEAGPQDVLDWLDRQDMMQVPLIYATAAPQDVRQAQSALGTARAGELVEHALAQCAEMALARGVRRFVVAGGETSGAVTQALGVDRLNIGPEIAPGVPWCFAEAANSTVALALKSGNFGAETFFADALQRLEAP